MLSIFGFIVAITLGFACTNEGWAYLAYVVATVGLSGFFLPTVSLDEITRFAESGEWWAEYYLGCLYQTGDTLGEIIGEDEFWKSGNDWTFYSVTGQNFESAVVWYKKAAEKGCIPAQNNLGGMYKDGIGVEQNPSEAIRWLTPPAEKGVSEAQFNLGVILKGNIHDYTQAFRWLNKAARQGNLDAMAQVALMYLDGQGREKNYKKGIGLFKKAADKGHSQAQFFLGLGFVQGCWGLDLDYRKAFEWFSKATEQGNALAECELAKLYRQGYGVEQDTSKAVEYLFSSACKGDCGAALELGDIYQSAESEDELFQILAYAWWQIAQLSSNYDLHHQDDLRTNVPESMREKSEGIEHIIKSIFLLKEASRNDEGVSMYELYQTMVFILLNLPTCPKALLFDNSVIGVYSEFKLNVLVPRDAIQSCVDAHLKYAGLTKKKHLEIMLLHYSLKHNSVDVERDSFSLYFGGIAEEFVRLAAKEGQATVECATCKKYVQMKIEYVDDRAGLPGWHDNREERWCCPSNHLVYQASLPPMRVFHGSK